MSMFPLMINRIVPAAALTFAGLVLVACSDSSTPDEGWAATPTISGPISGGLRGWPFTAALLDLSQFGFIEDEYFIEGTANTYRPDPDKTFGSDGDWDAVVTGTYPYKSRFLVRRPADRGNSTVRSSWSGCSPPEALIRT